MNHQKKWLSLLIWIASILALDQLTKYWIVSTIPVGGGWELIPHFADIVHYRNPGAAFGMLSGWDSNYRNYFFFAVSLVAIVILIYYISKSPRENKRTTIPLMMILGGAVGNIVDRILRGNVVDFILLHWYDKKVTFQIFGKAHIVDLIWPAFNVADSCITIGVVWLLATTLFAKKEVGSISMK